MGSLEAHELTYLLDRLRVGEIMTRTVVVIRVRTINPGPVVWALQARGFTAREPWRD